MSRGMVAANVTEAAKPHTRPVTFFEIQFDSGTLRLHDHIGPIPWGGNQWDGLGALGQVSPVQESEQLGAYRVSLQLSGVDSTIIAEAREQQVFERLVIHYLGFIGDDGALVADPDERNRFYADHPEISLGGGIDTVTLVCESEKVRDRVANGILSSDEDQQRLHPGDTGFQYIPQMVDARIWWGPGGRDSTIGVPTSSTEGASPSSGNQLQESQRRAR